MKELEIMTRELMEGLGVRALTNAYNGARYDMADLEKIDDQFDEEWLCVYGYTPLFAADLEANYNVGERL